jgi:hypothetical protein
MRMTRVCWIGVAMIAASLTLLASAILWSNTRTWSLVDKVPISLSQGSHYSTGELRVNLNARYEIDIYADNKIDPEKLRCTLGTGSPRHPCDSPSTLRVRWVLSSEGETVQGDSDDTGGLGELQTGSLESARTIGFFRGQKGHRYKLDVYVLSDTSSLNVTNPRLDVHEQDPSLEFNLVLIPFLGIFCTVVAAIVGLMLIGSFFAQRRALRIQ